MEFKIVLQKEDDGGYSVYVPELPGCISQGDTEEESINNIKEAIYLYLEDLNNDELNKLKDKVKIIQTTVKSHA